MFNVCACVPHLADKRKRWGPLYLLMDYILFMVLTYKSLTVTCILHACVCGECWADKRNLQVQPAQTKEKHVLMFYLFINWIYSFWFCLFQRAIFPPYMHKRDVTSSATFPKLEEPPMLSSGIFTRIQSLIHSVCFLNSCNRLSGNDVISACNVNASEKGK